MSIILNALRSREAAKSATEKMWPKEGLFFSVPVEKTAPNATRVSLLIMILFAASAFAVVRFSSRYFTAQSLAFPVEKGPVPLSELKLPEIKAAPTFDANAAKALFAQNRMEESLNAYEELVKQTPADATLLNDMGLVLMKLDRVLEAEGRIQAALKINPGCAECYNNLGMLSTKMGRVSDAEKYLKMATVLKKGYADPYFNLGVLFEKNGDNANALVQFEAFLKTTPDPNAPIAVQVKNHMSQLLEASE